MDIYENKLEFGWEGDDGIGELLIEQIINGTKTATYSLKIEYTKEELEDLYATKGQMATVFDKNGEPKCNVKILDVYETSLNKPDIKPLKTDTDKDNFSELYEDLKNSWGQTIKGTPSRDTSLMIVELIELVEVF